METITGDFGWLQRGLLLCGIVASLLNVATDRLAGGRLKGYRFAVQSMSELSAAGSPTRPLVLALTSAAAVLMIAFAAGVWSLAGAAIAPRIVVALVGIHVAAGLAASVFFPTRFGERPAFLSANVLVMLVSVVCFVSAMIVGAFAFGGWLRVLSIVIPAGYVLLAVLRFATAASTAETASIGAQERTMSYSFLLWVAAVAVYLLAGGG